MPKIKTNRTAYKKYRLNAGGKVKKAQANTSHNTAKRRWKRIRNLRKSVLVDATNIPAIRRMLPNIKKRN